MALESARRAGVDDEERAGLLVDLATAEFRAGRFGRELEHAVAASDAAAACGRADLLAAAALAVHDVSAARPAAGAASGMCERALARSTPREPVLRSRLLSQAASPSPTPGRLGAAADRWPSRRWSWPSAAATRAR